MTRGARGRSPLVAIVVFCGNSSLRVFAKIWRGWNMFVMQMEFTGSRMRTNRSIDLFDQGKDPYYCSLFLSFKMKFFSLLTDLLLNYTATFRSFFRSRLSPRITCCILSGSRRRRKRKKAENARACANVCRSAHTRRSAATGTQQTGS